MCTIAYQKAKIIVFEKKFNTAAENASLINLHLSSDFRSLWNVISASLRNVLL